MGVDPGDAFFSQNGGDDEGGGLLVGVVHHCCESGHVQSDTYRGHFRVSFTFVNTGPNLTPFTG